MITRQRIFSVIEATFELENFELQDEMTAKDVPNWDSLAHIDLIMQLEEEFGLRFTVDDIADLNTVGDMVSMLQNKVGNG